MKMMSTTAARAITAVELASGAELLAKAYGVAGYPRLVTKDMTWLCAMVKTAHGAFVIAALGGALMTIGAGAVVKMRSPHVRVGELMMTTFHAVAFANCYAFRALAGVYPLMVAHAVCVVLFQLGDVDLMSYVPLIGTSSSKTTKAAKGKKTKAKAAAPKRSSSRASSRRR